MLRSLAVAAGLVSTRSTGGSLGTWPACVCVCVHGVSYIMKWVFARGQTRCGCQTIHLESQIFHQHPPAPTGMYIHFQLIASHLPAHPPPTHFKHSTSTHLFLLPHTHLHIQLPLINTAASQHAHSALNSSHHPTHPPAHPLPHSSSLQHFNVRVTI